MSPEYLLSLQEQAKRISQGDKDLSQNLLAMSFTNFQNASAKGKELSIGELVNFMKNRSKEIRSGSRIPFGSVSGKTTDDVFHKKNYYSGSLEIMSLDYDDEDIPNFQVSIKDLGETIAFNLTFEAFLKTLHPVDRRILQMKLAGYKYREISEAIKVSYISTRDRLKYIGLDFVKYFELPEGCFMRYGLLN